MVIQYFLGYIRKAMGMRVYKSSRYVGPDKTRTDKKQDNPVQVPFKDEEPNTLEQCRKQQEYDRKMHYQRM